MHGRPTVRAWTKLGETAVAGATTLRLQQAVDWAPGSEIVVAPTSWDRAEAETLVIASVQDDGRELLLEAPGLRFDHLGETRTFGGRAVELRAEVGLLSHSVVLQGDDLSSAPNLYGVHALLGGGGAPLAVRLSDVEFRRCGQAFRMGRCACPRR